MFNNKLALLSYKEHVVLEKFIKSTRSRVVQKNYGMAISLPNLFYFNSNTVYTSFPFLVKVKFTSGFVCL